MKDDARIMSLAPWFGGKRTLAPAIVEAIGPHRVYWEPFCGSLAVLLAKPAVKMETVNDLHADLINLARVVQDPRLAVHLYDRLARTLFAEALFREALAAVRSEPVPPADARPGDRVDRAYRYFVVSWQGLNGVAGTPANNTSFARRFTSSGGNPGGRFVAAVDSIPPWHHRLRPVTILSDDGIALCEEVEDKPGTVIYADPPYLEKGASYLHDFTRGERSGSPALFEGAEDDHERLARALRRFKKTRVVVSYYDHRDLAQLYPGWRKIRLDAAKGMVNSAAAAAGRTEAPEVLLVNQG